MRGLLSASFSLPKIRGLCVGGDMDFIFWFVPWSNLGLTEHSKKGKTFSGHLLIFLFFSVAKFKTLKKV